MSLATGTRLGPYEIVAAIGAGGMGEVYRARDTRLHRDVAIKILPAHLGADPAALARFEREAQAVAALSHPNILAIHDFGVDAGTAYAVMELLEGDTLRQRLAEGLLPVRRTIAYAAQIARGLAAAHDKNIVHRDLKPENLFITKDERVKILDFGLARAAAVAAGTDQTYSPTMNRPTEPGTVLGTVGYMSPEQVRGEEADHRSDIFSFGAVLYEMATGRRAFERGTSAETMTAILREEPPDLAQESRAVPPAVDGIVRHCLEKKAEARFRSAHDLAFALETLSGSSSSVSPGQARASRPAWRWAVGAAAVVVALATGGGFWLGRRGDTGNAAAVSPALPTFRQLTFSGGLISAARFTPDGQTVVFSVRRGHDPFRLYMTRPGSPGRTPLPLPDAALLAVSPAAELAIGVDVRGADPLDIRGTLARAPLLGGSPRPVVESVQRADWDPSGRELAVVRVVGSRERLEFPSGHLLYETTGQIGSLRVSPKGDMVAFLDWPIKNDDRGSVAVIDRTGQKRTLTALWEGVQGLAWSPEGREVWFTASSGENWMLHAVTLDGRLRTVLTIPGRMTLEDIGRDGKALIARYDRAIRVAGLFGDEANERDLSWLEESFLRDVSPDGRLIVMTHSGAGSNSDYDVYLRRTDGSDATRLGEGQAQQLSPDGRWVLSIAHGPPIRVLLLPTGAGESKTVATATVAVAAGRWLPDGERLLLVGTEPGRGQRAYVVPVGGGTPRPVSPEGVSYATYRLALSPDGSRVALRASDGALMLYPIESGEPVPVRGLMTSEMPFGWTGDSRALLLLTGDPPRRIERLDPASGRRELVKEIRPSDPGLMGPNLVFMTRDGRSYVANYRRINMTLFLVEGLR